MSPFEGRNSGAPNTANEAGVLDGHSFLDAEFSAAQAAQIRADHTTAATSSVAAQFISNYQSAETARYAQVAQEMSFIEYIDALHADPARYVRNIGQYIADAFEFYGFSQHEILGHKIMDFNVRKFPWQSHQGGEQRELVGQEIPTYQYYLLNKQAGQRERPDTMILGFGPPGSGKTLFFTMRDEMLEDYSRNHPEGALYRLVWCFSQEELRKIGFRELIDSGERKLEPDEILRIPADNNTDPFFVISNERRSESPNELSPREQLLQSVLASKHADSRLNRAYFLSRGLDTLSQSILEQLSRFYKGDMAQIISRHVRVERWDMSAELGRGIVSIEANPDPHSNVRPVFPENHWEQQAIPRELSSGRELQRVGGLLTGANRGVAHFCDMLRLNQSDRGESDLSRFNFLLEAVEGGRLQIFNPRDPSSIRKVRTSIAYSGDCNAEDVLKRLQAPGFDALRERIRFLCFGLPVRFLCEADRYRDHMRATSIEPNAIGPNALEALALFAVSTRLLKPDAARTEYRAVEDLPNVIKGLSVIEKALLLEERNAQCDANLLRARDKELSPAQVQLLRRSKQLVADEYTTGVGETRFSLYDGGMGISVRSAIKLIDRIISQSADSTFTCIDVVQHLEQQLAVGFGYYEEIAASKRQYAAQAQKHIEKSGQTVSEESVKRVLEQWFPVTDPSELVSAVTKYARKKVEFDISQALGLMTPDSARELVVRYGYHAAAALDPGNFKVPVAYRESRMKNDSGASEEILRSFEDECTLNRKFGSDAARKAFRSEIISEIGSWSTRNPGLAIEKNLDQALAKLIEEVEKAQRIGREDTLDQFLETTRSFCGGGLVLEQELKSSDPERVRRAREWKSTFSRIEAMKYPKESIARHIEWALGHN